MLLEPVWVAFFRTTFSGEQLTARVIVGATLVLLALLIIATGSRSAAMAPPGAAEVIPVPVVSGTDRPGIVADSGPSTIGPVEIGVGETGSGLTPPLHR